MRFFQVVLSGAALISAAMADVSFTKVPTSVQAGQSVDIEWTATGTGPVTILLRKGPSENLGEGVAITTTGSNGKFTWAVPTSLVNGNDYAFEIVQGDDNNFSGQFAVSGGTGSASSSARSSSASASASASSAASSSGSVTSAASATSASVTASASSNGTTVSSATLSRTASRSSSPTGSSTQSASVPESTGGASTLITSPLALIFGAIAAMAYLN